MNIDTIEMYAANAFHTILAKHRLAAVNTIIGIGEHTYFGSRSSSMIDYLRMPADCTERIKACRVLHSAAHQLAPFEKVNKFMDHKPILGLCDLGLRHDRTKKNALTKTSMLKRLKPNHLRTTLSEMLSMRMENT